MPRSPKYRFSCPFCRETFRSLQKRARHVSDIHPESVDAQEKDVGGRGLENDYVSPGIRRRHIRQLEDIQEDE